LSKIETACLTETAKQFLPPERCVFNPHRPKSVRPRNSFKLSCRRERCQPADITGFPPVFNSAGSLNQKRGTECNWLLKNSLLR
jgi:hypothetical protein